MKNSITILETDMDENFQKIIVKIIDNYLNQNNIINTKLASYIKTELDNFENTNKWQCHIGSSLSCWFSFDSGTFAKVACENKKILIFKSS